MGKNIIENPSLMQMMKDIKYRISKNMIQNELAAQIDLNRHMKLDHDYAF